MIPRLLATRPIRWAMAALSGALMVLSFPYTGSCFLLAFLAWIPLLLVESTYTGERKSAPLFFQAYLTFFIYNLGTTWWIYYASPEGAYMAFICNSLVMAVAFYVFHRLKRRLGERWGTFILCSTWIAFEYLHFHWELSWPWLTLGNMFADVPQLVQWYSITGVLGGSFWILLANCWIYHLIAVVFIEDRQLFPKAGPLYRVIGVFAVPIVLSGILYSSHREEKAPYEVIIIQPNIDPYGDKFNRSEMEQLHNIMSQADKKVTRNTRMVIAPETALCPIYALDEADIHQTIAFHQLMEHKVRWHSASFLIGASTHKYFDEKHSIASRQLRDGPGFEEYYNSSVLFKDDRTPVIVHKSKLVLGVEKIPFAKYIPWLEELSIDLGGSSGTLGVEDRGPTIMETQQVKLAPVVCYESIYGSFIANQCRQGAQYIAVITNDGWWRDTPGYRQHFAFSRLRAVENRKYVVRSANTGKSGVIDQLGNVRAFAGWNRIATLRSTIQLSDEKTIYQTLGDWPGWLAAAGFAFFFIGGRVGPVRRMLTGR